MNGTNKGDVDHIRKVHLLLKKAEKKVDWIGNKVVRQDIEETIIGALRTVKAHLDARGHTPIHYDGSDLVLTLDEFTPEQQDHLLSIGGSGQQDANVQAYREAYPVSGDPETCRLYLKGYGAWDDDELSDHEANLDRLVWLTGCGLTEEDGEAYFSAY